MGTFLDRELVEKIPFEEISKQFNKDLKPIKKENIHMTWIFFGDVETIHELPIQNIIEKHIYIFKDLTFESQGLELWPPRKSPRLIILSGSLNKQLSLTNLIQDLKTVCNPDEKGNFLPHITISRFKKDRTVGVSFKLTLPIVENFIWQIKEIALVQSILSSEGPVYKEVNSWEL